MGEFWTDCNYDEAGSLVYDQDSHRQAIVDWCDATGGTSTAFDFTTKASHSLEARILQSAAFSYICACNLCCCPSSTVKSIQVMNQIRRVPYMRAFDQNSSIGMKSRYRIHVWLLSLYAGIDICLGKYGGMVTLCGYGNSIGG